MSDMRTIAVAAALACALPLAACGKDESPGDGEATQAKPATQVKPVEINGERTSGRRAEATARGIVRRPQRISLRVSAAPTQRVDVSWGISCPKTAAGKDDKPKGGTYTTTTPNVHALRLPSREIAFCAVNAQAQLTRSGRIKIAILGGEG
jgi:hypothetical protein